MSEHGTWNAPADEVSDGRPEPQLGGPAWDRPQRRWLERTLGVADRSGSISVAVMVGVLAAASFIASLTYDWQQATFNVAPNGGDTDAPAVFTYNLSPGSTDGLTTVYVLAILVLLGGIGTAVAWPQVAHRLRVAATGVGAGLIGVVTALAVRLPDQAGVLASQYEDRLSSTVEPGVYFGFATVVLCVVALWLAGPSPRRAQPSLPVPVSALSIPDSPAPSPRKSTVDSPSPPQPYEIGGQRPTGSVNDLTVSPAEPIDLTTHPGVEWGYRGE